MFKSEKQKIRAIFAGIILLTLIAAMIDFGQFYNKTLGKTLPQTKEIPFRLGLDLLGGTHLVYKADVSQVPSTDRSSAVEGVRDVIERRVNVFGVSEPVVQTAKSGGDYRIIVELAGIKDINQAIKMIGETPLLEFKEENNTPKELTSDQQKQMDDYNKTAEKNAQDVLGKAISGGDFAALAQEFSDDTDTKDKGGALGWVSSDSTTYPELIAAVETLQSGSLVRDLVTTDDTFQIVKLNDKRAQKEGDLGLDKKEVKASHLLICYQGAEQCDSNLSKDDARKKIEELKAEATPQNFAQLAADNSTEPGAETSKGELGWFTRDKMVPSFSDVVLPQNVGTISDVVETQFGFHLIYKEAEQPLEYAVS